jgi:peroxiredoxin
VCNKQGLVNEPRVLHVRQLIPPLTLLTAERKTVRAWDFKQKNNLVIAFLDAECQLCEAFVRALSSHAAELREKDTTVLLVFSEGSPLRMCGPLPAEIIVGADRNNHGVRQFLGEVATSSQRRRRGVFVTDRYGEVSTQWIVPQHEFPPMRDVLSAINLVEIACEECFPPEWPAED